MSLTYQKCVSRSRDIQLNDFFLIIRIRLGANPHFMEMPYRNDEDQRRYQEAYSRQRKQTHRSVKVTMTLAEFGKLEELAKVEKASVPSLILNLALNRVGEAPFVSSELKERLDEAIRLIRSCANNINQIAHACNLQAGFMDEPKSPQEGIEILTGIHEGLVRMEVLFTEKLP